MILECLHCIRIVSKEARTDCLSLWYFVEVIPMASKLSVPPRECCKAWVELNSDIVHGFNCKMKAALPSPLNSQVPGDIQHKLLKCQGQVHTPVSQWECIGLRVVALEGTAHPHVNNILPVTGCTIDGLQYFYAFHDNFFHVTISPIENAAWCKKVSSIARVPPSSCHSCWQNRINGVSMSSWWCFIICDSTSKRTCHASRRQHALFLSLRFRLYAHVNVLRLLSTLSNLVKTQSCSQLWH